MVYGWPMKLSRAFSIFSSALLVFSLLASPTFAAGNSSKNRPNENAIGYWTAERLANAIPREFEFEPDAKSGKLVQTGKPSKGGGGTTNTAVSGANWNSGGLPLTATGKVFFTEESIDYVCSGSIVNDTNSSNLIVLTAGHCLYDNASQKFVSNFIFIPSYDNTKTSNCYISTCLPARALVAHSGFTTESAFTTKATQYDWGFAVINQPSPAATGLNLKIDGFTGPTNIAYSFGYPQSSPYNGQELVYCSGGIIEDRRTSNTTWGLGCNMTGGASGGPWTAGYVSNTNPGTASSVNSYKYSTDKNRMYGPKFNQFTQNTFTVAEAHAGTENLKVP